ncbi:putative peptidase family c78 protein [Phaeoacremonium minimum UCRPA7]|uniref:Putative peptidase family c78 protein n=1 Tax=Phaeoacremonium minimum (strain UCR-PA7) TaxID=1286976 RepID=R8BA10_PHAM7|nr:putative peptidase family c78 protein [Phaeoacremonium minimum UCRPA7]EON96155.1 putative peptidase family c78 protein [Phaeoacremonium minimum UCRPA7]
MATDGEVMTCPFCGFRSVAGEYEMLLHMETLHAEGKSPFIADSGPQQELLPDQDQDQDQDGEDQYAECPVEGCGEVLLVDELDYHLELHDEESDAGAAAEASEQPVPPPRDEHPRASRRAAERERQHGRTSVTKRNEGAIQTWKKLFGVPATKARSETTTEGAGSKEGPRKRLGKAELGKYAHEQRMPEWLHVSKLRREGGFCGYRNIQMLSSFIVGTNFEGADHFNGNLPSIFDIQDFIEEAWDRGINSQGRVETGGVKGTRKYIGTPEAQAMLISLQVPCDAQGFKNKEPGRSEELLLQEVERYFQSSIFDPEKKVRCTSMPPIYFQHAGHSMTIIGFERLQNGQANLLVFDPMFRDNSAITRLVGKKFESRAPDILLKPYRRGSKYLGKYREFELLR